MKMTPRELELAYKGYERAERQAWERARYICYYSAAPHSKGIKGLQDIKLPIDKPREITRDMLVKTRRLDG